MKREYIKNNYLYEFIGKSTKRKKTKILILIGDEDKTDEALETIVSIIGKENCKMLDCVQIQYNYDELNNKKIMIISNKDVCNNSHLIGQIYARGNIHYRKLYETNPTTVKIKCNLILTLTKDEYEEMALSIKTRGEAIYLK